MATDTSLLIMNTYLEPFENNSFLKQEIKPWLITKYYIIMEDKNDYDDWNMGHKRYGSELAE